MRSLVFGETVRSEGTKYTCQAWLAIQERTRQAAPNPSNDLETFAEIYV